MNWAQVADDFIKIGLPSLCTAGVALLIGKFTRSHEFEKERRRRKQDFLTSVADQFEEFESALRHVGTQFALFILAKSQNVPDATIRQQELLQSIDALNAIDDKLHRLGTKLDLFGFWKCRGILSDYEIRAGEYRAMLHEEDPDLPLEAAKIKWMESAEQFRQTLAAAYNGL